LVTSTNGVREPEVADETKPELDAEQKSEILEEPESEPDLEVVDELDPEPNVEESLIETHVGLPTETVMKLSPSSPAMRVPLSLRPPDVYDPLQIFL